MSFTKTFALIFGIRSKQTFVNFFKAKKQFQQTSNKKEGTSASTSNKCFSLFLPRYIVFRKKKNKLGI